MWNEKQSHSCSQEKKKKKKAKCTDYKGLDEADKGGIVILSISQCSFYMCKSQSKMQLGWRAWAPSLMHWRIKSLRMTKFITVALYLSEAARRKMYEKEFWLQISPSHMPKEVGCRQKLFSTELTVHRLLLT